MRTVETLNSVYEVDAESSRVRRVRGQNDPCNYIGEDGLWQPYQRIIDLGDRLVFVGENPTRGFVTSTIVSDTES